MVWALLGLAWAGPAEEVVVYGDPFARWDGTRWFVETELMLPLGATLAARDNAAVTSEALQLSAVLLCDKDARLGPKRFEVDCEVEDVGLSVIASRWQGPADRARVARILDQLDARMTGLRVQLQVDAEGGVPIVHLEGIADSRDRDDRRHDEALRTVVAQVMAGFHLRVPDQGTRVGTWEEHNPTLLRIPGLLPSAGSTRMVHTVSRRGDLQIVQTLGEGGASLPLPNPKMENPFICIGPPDLQSDTCKAFADEYPPGELLDLDAQFDLSASGVAVFDRGTGILTERVWQVTGAGRIPGYGVTLPPYVNRGRLTLLGIDDHPDVGPTRQVAPPGHRVDGLDPWVPLEP